MEAVVKEDTIHLWYGKPNKILSYSHEGKSYEVLFAITQLDDKSIHVVFSCPSGMLYSAAQNNNYLKDSRIFNSYESFIQELQIKEEFKATIIFCYNLFKGRQKSFVFKAQNGCYYEFVIDYNYDTFFLSKKISPLSGNPMNQSIYEKETHFFNKTDNIPPEIQEKITILIDSKYKFDPEDIQKIITTPNNRVTCLISKKNSWCNSKSFFCDKPMDINEIRNLVKGSYVETVYSGYASREIFTSIEDFNKTVSKNKNILKIIGFDHSSYYDDKSCRCDCYNRYVGLTNEFQICQVTAYSDRYSKPVDPEIEMIYLDK